MKAPRIQAEDLLPDLGEVGLKVGHDRKGLGLVPWSALQVRVDHLGATAARLGKTLQIPLEASRHARGRAQPPRLRRRLRVPVRALEPPGQLQPPVEAQPLVPGGAETAQTALGHPRPVGRRPRIAALGRKLREPNAGLAHHRADRGSESQPYGIGVRHALSVGASEEGLVLIGDSRESRDRWRRDDRLAIDEVLAKAAKQHQPRRGRAVRHPRLLGDVRHVQEDDGIELGPPRRGLIFGERTVQGQAARPAMRSSQQRAAGRHREQVDEALHLRTSQLFELAAPRRGDQAAAVRFGAIDAVEQGCVLEHRGLAPAPHDLRRLDEVVKQGAAAGVAVRGRPLGPEEADDPFGRRLHANHDDIRAVTGA